MRDFTDTEQVLMAQRNAFAEALAEANERISFLERVAKEAIGASAIFIDREDYEVPMVVGCKFTKDYQRLANLYKFLTEKAGEVEG